MSSSQAPAQDTSAAASARRLAAARRRHRSGEDPSSRGVGGLTTPPEMLPTARGSTSTRLPPTMSSSAAMSSREAISVRRDIGVRTPGADAAGHASVTLASSGEYIPSTARLVQLPATGTAARRSAGTPSGPANWSATTSGAGMAAYTAGAGSESLLRTSTTAMTDTSPSRHFSTSGDPQSYPTVNPSVSLLTSGSNETFGSGGNLQGHLPSRSGVNAAVDSARAADSRPSVKSNLHGAALSSSLLNTSLGSSSAALSASMASTTKPYPSLFASSSGAAQYSESLQPTSTPARSGATSLPSQTPSVHGRLSHGSPRRDPKSGIDPGEGLLETTTIEDQELILRDSLSVHFDEIPRDAACITAETKVQIFAFQSPLPATARTNSFAAAAAASPLRFGSRQRAGAGEGEHEDDWVRCEVAETLVDVKGVLDCSCDSNSSNSNTQWTIVKVPRSPTVPFAFPGGDALICFGDIVTIRACPSDSEDDEEMALTVIKQEGSESRLLVSPVAGGSLEQEWTIVRGMTGPDALVRVGESALQSLSDNATARRRGIHRKSTKVAMSSFSPFVRSGDSLLLRSCANGGILSTRPDGSLMLRTDSYDSNIDRNRPSSQSDLSLLDRLQRHDLLSPSDGELFYVFPASVPSPCLRLPGNEFDPLSFQDGSYLLHDNRHLSDPLPTRSISKTTNVTGELLERRGSEFHKQRAAAMLQPQAQELLLLDEILGSFLGLEGGFVRVRRSWHLGLPDFRFHLLDGPNNSLVLDLSLRNIIENEFLPLSSAYVNIQCFLGSHLNKSYDYGTVMQALCERLDAIVYEYARFVISLEAHYRGLASTGINGPAVMRLLLADIQETAHKMRVLQHVVESVRAEKGGSLLNALEMTRRHHDGDAVASALVSLLLDASAVPYMQAFCRWIQSGRLEDPYEEFMVRFDSGARTWMDQYTIVKKHALVRFCASDAILSSVVATGRFWNAIRMCPGRGAAQHAEHLHDRIMYSSPVSDVLARVQSLHRTAARALVDLLLGECELFRSLRLTKRYFLLDQGDFFVRFMDAAEDELLKDSTDISMGRVQHWLSSAVNLTDQDASENKQSRNPHCVLLPSDLVTRFTTRGLLVHLDKLLASPSLVDSGKKVSGSPRRERAHSSNADDEVTGLDTFLIDFRSIPFPLSLVLTKQAMASYQLLFRHLFYTNYVERRLVGIWQDHQALRELQALRGPLGRTFLLRQRMLHFVQNLVYYMMMEVIEPNWNEFESEVLSSEALEKMNADDVCVSHTRFLRKTLEACLMTNRDVLGSITKLLGTCLLFTNEMKTFMRATRLDDDSRSVARDKRGRFQRGFTERAVPRRSSLSRSEAERIIVEDMAERRARIQQQTARVHREVSSESYRSMIARFDEVFSGHLSDFMLQLKYADGLFHSHKINLCTRLDYDGYASRAFGLSEDIRRKTHQGLQAQR